MTTGPDVTATFCATLVDEWVRAGVTDAVVCPGSRSTPMAVELAAHPLVRVHVHHDERSGGFMALGLGAAGRPAVMLTTSGTAAANLHPAVVEADLGRVPMIVVTANRPPELQDAGAPQTIDQTHLFGRSVRWFSAPGVPDDAVAHTWRALAARAVVEARHGRRGPVHLDLAFREPLVGTPGPLPPSRRGEPWTTQVSKPTAVTLLPYDFGHDLWNRRGVIVGGLGYLRGTPSPLSVLAERLGWPVLAGARGDAIWNHPASIHLADAVLRHGPSADALRPEVVIRVGEPPASRVVNEFLDSSGATHIVVLPSGRWRDPAQVADHVIVGPIEVACAGLVEALPEGHEPIEGWLADWQRREQAARTALDEVLAAHPEPTEPAIARTVSAAAEGHTLVVASSMPVRDVEWYAGGQRMRVVANRGANGIDGVTSTAVGVALGRFGPVVLLIGDVAFLHDTNGLLGLADRDVNLTIVVVDNDGGGIFSFLPQAGALDADRFEQLFGTPHGVDLAALAGAHHLPVVQPATAAEVGPAVAACLEAGGTHVVHIRTDRAANVAVHDEIHTAVAAALAALPPR